MLTGKELLVSFVVLGLVTTLIIIIIERRKENLVLSKPGVKSKLVKKFGRPPAVNTNIKKLGRYGSSVNPVNRRTYTKPSRRTSSKIINDKTTANNIVKLFKSLASSVEPGRFVPDKSIRDQLDTNSNILKNTKNGTKVLSIRGNVYVFDKRNRLLTSIEGYKWCDPNDSRCVAPEECIEEEVENGLLGETRFVCKKREYEWYIVLIIAILALLFGGAAASDDSSGGMGGGMAMTQTETFAILESFTEGGVDNVVVEEDSESGSSGGINGRLGLIKIPDITPLKETSIVESVQIIPNLRDLVRDIDEDSGNSTTSSKDCQECDRIISDVTRGVPGSFKEFIRCCANLNGTQGELPLFLEPKPPPRNDLIPEIDEDDIPVGERLDYKFCQGSDEIRVLQDGTRERNPRANVCCTAECIRGSWHKKCGISYDEFMGQGLEAKGEFWYPRMQSTEFLDIPCTDEKPCFYPDGQLRDCDEPTGTGGGLGGTRNIAPTVRNRNRIVRFSGI